MKIGIGLTTYGNRQTPALEMIRKHTPLARIVTVNVKGIAKAKNMCLALLDDCEHIFLFDDDCFPKVDNWYEPYINAGIPHLCYTFDRKVLSVKNGIKEHELPCGCMLYINRKCLDVVGGFDTDFDGYGFEHPDYSQRVCNAGLQYAPFLDVVGSNLLIHSMDEHKQIVSSVSQLDRGLGIQTNRHLFMKNRDSKEWKPYK
jgi:hypothetical protein